MGLNITPGDLLFVRYLDLDRALAAYQVIAVYDERFYYFHMGRMRIYDAPVSILEDKGLEVTVHRL